MWVSVSPTAALQGLGGFGFIFGARFVVWLPQKRGDAGNGKSGGLQSVAALGWRRRHQRPLKLRETSGKCSVITGEKS